MAPAMLLFFVTTSVWVASPPLTLMRVVGAGDGQRVKPCPPTSCGGVNISTPFGVLQEQAWESSCGAIGFQVRCSNNISYLAYSEQDHQFQILSIFYDNSSLLVADSHKLQALDGSVDESCRVPKNNGSARIGFPFSISPTNNILVLYNCTKAPASLEGLVETRCGTTTTFARVVGSYDDDGGNSNYSVEGSARRAAGSSAGAALFGLRFTVSIKAAEVAMSPASPPAPGGGLVNASDFGSPTHKAPVG
ncbi:hypothetical protein HU200_055412 [Digitaria exilis]|uniref:Wall-associated receptor kinase galacturonan-binding domain-containing protein n=1 Tax=Digitaria exilis TaxID=1010633 RepID=A0A835ADD8_9POAL|nr:hypothetical protein HU200_055412 [Digitaria exilis]